MNCEECDAKIAKDSKFCKECGARVGGIKADRVGVSEEAERESGGMILKVFLGLVVLVVIGLVLSTFQQESTEREEVWEMAMTKGNPENERHFIMYTDMFCPFCAQFNIATKGGFEADFIETDKIFFEMRLTAPLGGPNSIRGAESGYCAARQGQELFWVYFYEVLARVDTDFWSAGRPVPDLDDEYFLAAAETAGLDVELMIACLASGEELANVIANTERLQRAIPGAGVPYFQLGRWTSSGFSGDYAAVRRLMRAAGVE
ncbi:DsbA family protein [Candidatus Saccharibacteria bacterium]|nr:DsbA family protein [Candidatus Saccharibacteria bacterium]